MTTPPDPDAGERPRPPKHATDHPAAQGSAAGADATPTLSAPSTRQEELRSFLFFTVVMAPVISVLLVATYGFVIWMYQLLAGPPGS